MFVLAFSWSNKKKFHQLGMSNDDKDFDLAYACNARNILFIPCYKVLFVSPIIRHKVCNFLQTDCIPQFEQSLWTFYISSSGVILQCHLFLDL